VEKEKKKEHTFDDNGVWEKKKESTHIRACVRVKKKKIRMCI
jgi:hypothetical protein